MNELGVKEINIYFPRYLNEWQKLEHQYWQTPSWRMLKRFNILRAKTKLTKAYEAKMKEWELE